MKRGVSGSIGGPGDNSTVGCEHQPIAFDQLINLMQFELLLDFRSVVVVVAERLVHLGGRQVGQALQDFLDIETQPVVTYDGLDRSPGAPDDGAAAANAGHLGDVAILSRHWSAHGHHLFNRLECGKGEP